MSDSRNRLLARVSAPGGEPVTLNEAKIYLRVTYDDEDMLINDIIVSARLAAEDWLKRSLMAQSWKLAYGQCLPERVELPMGPVNSITSVRIVNRDGSTQTIDSSTYYLNAAQDTLVFDSALVGFRIEITYATGYGTADDVPHPIKQGLLTHIACLYDSRGEMEYATMPPQTMALYMPYRGIAL